MFPNPFSNLGLPFAQAFNCRCYFNTRNNRCSDFQPRFLYSIPACQSCLKKAHSYLSPPESQVFESILRPPPSRKKPGPGPLFTKPFNRAPKRHHTEMDKTFNGLPKKFRKCIDTKPSPPGKRCSRRAISMDAFKKYYPDFNFPMPIKIKTEKDIEVIEAKRRNGTYLTKSIEVKKSNSFVDAASKNPSKTKTKNVVPPDAKKKRKKVVPVVTNRTTKKVKKRGIQRRPINSWYNKNYVKMKYDKVKIVLEKIAPEVLLKVTKNWQSCKKIKTPPPSPNALSQSPKNVFPVTLWSTQDWNLLPIKDDIIEVMEPSEIVTSENTSDFIKDDVIEVMETSEIVTPENTSDFINYGLDCLPDVIF